jgi:hypothetical protein
MMCGPKPARRPTNQGQYVRLFTSHVTGTEMNDKPLTTSQARRSHDQRHHNQDAASEQPEATVVQAKTLKELLSSAPLEGIALDRQNEAKS